ncbi:hypothetical protein EON63_12120, partial [archaeon]
MEEELSLQYTSLSLSDNMESYTDDAANHLASLQSEQGTCNLIVNYLPHDVDDLALRVSRCAPYTIHHTPYTIHHTPYTIHHIP